MGGWDLDPIRAKVEAEYDRLLTEVQEMEDSMGEHKSITSGRFTAGTFYTDESERGEVEVRSPKLDGPKLCNEYGSHLTLDAVRLELQKHGWDLSSPSSIDWQVSKRVEKIRTDQKLAEWVERKETRSRQLHAAVVSVFALVAVQVMLLLFGVAVGDWKPAEFAGVLGILDVAGAVGCGILAGRVPAESTRPTVSGY